jgi:hypothetical protein
VDGGVTIDNITIDGTEIDLSSGDLTIDVAGDITLDAGGSDIRFDGGGSEYGKLNLSGNNLNIHSSINDADIVFKGEDGGSTITALTLDMSDAGTASFNHDIKLSDNSKALFGDDSDFEIYHSGSASIVREASAGNLVLAGNDVNITNGAMDETHIDCNNNGSVDLYHNNSKKLETASGGVTITGTLTTDAANVPQEALTSSSNAVAWDATAKPNAFHVTTENTTFAAPTNNVEGAFICLEINYNGSHTIAFNTVFEFAGSTAPTFTSTDGKTDILVFRYNGSVWQEVGRTLNLSES